MELFPILLIVGVACLAMAGIVALVRPFEKWKSVATRLSVLGVVLAVVGLIWGALTGGFRGLV